MLNDVLYNLGAWAFALLVYPGLIFAAGVALVGEWLASTLRPLATPRLYRSRARLGGLFDPLFAFLKLLGRRDAVRWQPYPGPDAEEGEAGNATFSQPHPAESVLALLGALSPLVVLALIPLGANPLPRDLAIGGDLFLLLALLAIYPISLAAILTREGGLRSLAGMHAVGALLTGGLPTLVLVAALIAVAGTTSLNLVSLLGAPETAQQAFVRLLAGVGLLVALPWWLGSRPSEARAQTGGAAGHAGRYFQAAALAGLWSALALPAPGDATWHLLLSAGGTLAAYVLMRLLAERWWPARRLSEAANLVWATTLPLGAVALALSYLA